MKQDMDTIKNIQLLLEQIPVVLEEIRRQNYTFALKRISAIVQSLACLLEALEESNVKHDYILFPNSGHSLYNDPDKMQEYRAKMKEYVEIYFQN